MHSSPKLIPRMDRQLSGEGVISLKGNDLGSGGNHPGSNFQGWRAIFLGSICPTTANKVLLKEIRIPKIVSISVHLTDLTRLITFFIHWTLSISDLQGTKEFVRDRESSKKRKDRKSLKFLSSWNREIEKGRRPANYHVRKDKTYYSIVQKSSLSQIITSTTFKPLQKISYVLLF